MVGALPWDIGNPTYAITVRVPGGDFDAIVQKVREELSREGFGVLTEIDLKTTLKKKLDVDVPRYLILGACHPELAHMAVKAEPGIGALLPCNVVVAQEKDAVAVSAIDPLVMFSVVGRPDIVALASQVKEKLSRSLNGVGSSI
ncbi:MAG: DUF302 domain-containing protein [Gemmatimonadetes bacterium]|nr:DUF302 domain-containing protein [Gemmatimonadota bacterium]